MTHIHFEKKISSYGDCFHAFLGLLIAWGNTISCARSYFCPCLIRRRMHIHCENKISSGGDYFYALFWLFIAWSSTIRGAISYFFPCLILIILRSYFEKKRLAWKWSSKRVCCMLLSLLSLSRPCIVNVANHTNNPRTKGLHIFW